MKNWRAGLLGLAALAVLGSGQAAAQEPLTPLPYLDKTAVPSISQRVKVLFKTDAGDFTLEIYPQAAPNAAARFLDLVKRGFYDNTPLFRVVPKFVVQFGINWRGVFPQFKEKGFPDDPSLYMLEPGTIAFAKGGRDTNSSQVFINFGDNSRLALQGDFTAFGKVTAGMPVLSKFRPVGDPGMGLDQDKLWGQGEAYLRSLPAKPNMILKATIVP